MKRVRMGNVMEFSEDEEEFEEEIQGNMLHEECVIERPSNPNDFGNLRLGRQVFLIFSVFVH